MKRVLFACVVASVCVVLFSTPGSATTLGFDDLYSISGVGPIPNGYAGLNWDNFYFVDGVSYGAGGNAAGVTSLRNVAVNGDGDPAVMSDGLFTFESAYFTAAWIDELFTVNGLLDGNLVYSTQLAMSATSPTFFALNWSGINELRFAAGGVGTFAMDDFTFTDPPIAPVPEPASLLLLGTGLFGAARAVRKRRG